MTIYKYIIAVLIALSQSAFADDERAFSDWLDAANESGFSGAVLVASDTHLLLNESFGLANREERIPYSDDTIFNIGSLTKQFTATAILKLQEADKLSINDPLSNFFDRVPEDKKAITIHHLLTHTAGFVATRGEGSANLYDVVTRDELVEFAFQSNLVSAPGEEFNYSNVGYNLLAIIVEKVTNLSYEDYYYDALFKPAGLIDTGYRRPIRSRDRIAINYGADQTDFQRLFGIEAESRSIGSPFEHLTLEDGPRFNMEGAGGMSSTMGDLRRWYRALRSDRILSEESKNQLFAPHNQSLMTTSETYYGYGWDIQLTDRSTIHAQHNGSNGYSFADMHYYVDDDIFVVITTNDIDVYPQALMNDLLLQVESSLTNKND